jgi:oligoendopeptidase F
MPAWDLTPFFPSLDSSEFSAAFDRLVADVQRLDKLVDEKAQAGDAAAFDEIVQTYNQALEAQRLVSAYLYGLVTVDSRNEPAQAKLSEFETKMIPLSKIGTKITAWVGTLDVEQLIAQSETAKAHAFALRKAAEQAKRLMSPAEESLAAELNPVAAGAWGKLHSNMTSQLEVTVELPDGVKTMPMSAVRTLAYEADRAVRKAAYEAELAAWKEVEVPMAACINGIKGQVNVLGKRRQWADPLDEALFRLNIDRQTLDAMLEAAEESLVDFRRYFKAKARAIGVDTLEWYDIFAPLSATEKPWDYQRGCDFVERHFRAYSDKMGDFARRSFDENWVDAPPRPGKVDGAYCMGVRGDESRILMNYKPAFGSVKTLAHELGHAYHNICLAERTPLQKRTPSTLAETASIFCETIVKVAALQEVAEEEQVSILEGSLQGAAQVVVDIVSRYLFERSVFEGRRERDLSAGELSERMLDAQKRTYGDALASYHPYMWAVKPHYYSTSSYYNFPYMFGMLFGLGLYAQFEKDPDAFRANYDDLLSSTGMADGAELAGRFGIDIRSKEFWKASLDVVKQDIDLFDSRIG